MTVPHYGKREAGALTATTPGDTLYFAFGSYNDSGDSEAMSGFAVSDIEVFKNGIATTRATDSGYSLISDTGQVGDRVGLHRFSMQLYNTTDDTGFFDVGGWYQVAVDAVTIDGKTVRTWVGSFEIGRDKVNVEEIDGDTGPADNLGRIAGDTGTGSYIYRESDTGGIADAIWAKDIRTLTAFQFDTGVWGSNAARTLTAFQFDTGIWGSNFASGRTLTSFQFDTGVAATVWRSSTSSYTADTGSVAYAQGRIMAVRGDTGAAHLDQGRFGVLSDSGVAAAVLDTGKVASAVWTSHATRTLTAFQFDTGVWGSNFASGRTLTSFGFDTGIVQTVWRASPSTYTSDTGSFGYAAGRVMAIRNDTGAAHLDQGRFGVLSDSGVAAAVLDTGKVAAAVWTSHATRTLTAFAFDTGIWGSNFAGGRTLTSFAFDTGVAQTVWRESGSTYTDTGSLGYMIDNPPAASIDTGVVNQAVWQADASRTLTSFAYDTGIAQTVWRSSHSSYAADTGSLGYGVGTLQRAVGDTGVIHTVNGHWAATDSGVVAQVVDTGKVASAVWTSHQTRALTAFQFDTGVWGSNFAGGRTLTSFGFDTGVAQTVWRSSSSDFTGDTGSVGYAQGRLMAVKGDTGAAHLDAGRLGVSASATVDTGVINNAVWNGNVSDHVADTGSFGYAQGRLLAVKGDTGAAHLDAGRLGVSASATVDTGVINNAIWNGLRADHLVAGTFGRDLTDSGMIAAVLDTGKAAAAIWTSHATRLLTGSTNIDTGVADTVWKYSTSGATADTGSVGYAQGRLMAVKGDTGAAHLDAGRLGVSATATVDTGVVNNAVWNGNVSDHTGDTGSFGYAQGRLLAVKGDTGAAHLDAGRLGVSATATVDTGVINQAVWQADASRYLTAFGFDTGIAQTVWRSSTSGFTADTGSVGYAQGRLMAVKGDTGAAHLDQGRLGVLSDSGVAAAVLDTGKVAAAVWASHATRTLTAFALDTGVADTTWKYASRTLTSFAFDTGVWGSNASRTLSSFQFDTGIAATVWRQSTSSYTADTGSVAYAQGRIMAVRNDTGAAHLDQGRFGVLSDSGVAAAVLDTGKVAAAVWNSHATRTLTAFAFDTGIWGSNAARTLTSFGFDTGIVQTVWRASPSTYTADTGSFGYAAGRLMAVKGDTGAAHLDQGRLGVIADTGRQAAVLDTGKVASAVWASHQTRALTAFGFDTGIAQTVWRESTSSYTADTGSVAYAQGRVMAVRNDTGAAHLDQGRFGVISDSGRMAAVLDTGKVAAAVWTNHATRVLTANTNLAGLSVNVEQIDGDTGPADNLGRIAGDTGAQSYLANTVWDEVLSGATHNVATSAGRRLRGVQDYGAYENATVWIDTISGTSGTTLAENGTPDNPVDNLADATTIAVAGNLRHFHLANGSSVTLATSYDNYEFEGDEYTIALGGQSINNTSIHQALLVSGTYSGYPHILQSILGAITGPGCKVGMCAIADAIVLNANTNLTVLHNCWGVSAANSAFDFGVAVAANTVYIQDYWGPIEIRNMGTGDVLYFTGAGTLTLAASCTAGTVNVAGTVEVINNGSGLTINDTAVLDTGQIAGAVWTSHATRTLTAFQFDTGVAQTVWRESGSTYVDTGSLGYMVDNPPTSSIDTGQVNRAVWSADASRTLTAFGFDTGVAQTVWRESGSAYVDTGSLGYAIDNPAEHTVTLDTGVINRAVWVGDATRTLTTDLGAAIWTYGDTGVRSVNMRQLFNDTGAAVHLQKSYDVEQALGVPESVAAIKAKTDQLVFDTGGEVQADIRKVNNVTVTGTGTSGDEWGP